MIRSFVHEIESSLLMGEWNGYTDLRDEKETNPHIKEEFLLMKGGLVFDGVYFYYLGKLLDINLTKEERGLVWDAYVTIKDKFVIDNPTEDVLELASRFGGISGSRGKE